MELNLSSGWYIINPREVRSVKYYQEYNGREYSPDKIFDNLTDDEKKSITKIVEIELNDKIGEDGRRQANVLQINVSDDKLYNYIYKNFARKFRLKYSNNKINEKLVIRLFDKDFTIEEIADILKIKNNIIEKIIMEYKNKKTAYNRTVYASPPYGGSGYEKTQPGLRPLWVFSPPHFCGCWNCYAIPSSQPQKRHIQPKRYVPCRNY
jgi:hypothetical protein